MVNVIKQEVKMEESLRKRLEFICKFGINKCEALKRLFEGNPYTVQELDEKTIN